jgi:hypothetical protein
MCLQEVSVRRVAEGTGALSRVRVGEEAVSRIAQRLEEELLAWRRLAQAMVRSTIRRRCRTLKPHCSSGRSTTSRAAPKASRTNPSRPP